MNIGKAFKGKFATVFSELDGKASVNLDNLTQTGNANLVSVPNYNAGVAVYTDTVIPANGVIVGVHNFSDGGYRSLTINGNCLFNTRTGASYLNSQSAGHEYAVCKGDTISFLNYTSMVFYPYKKGK